ncbi:MAG: hypothetical protein HC788_05825, partial [Sphingopyxis sp.]|nr:hypothetical protein [Sphingopyxis sp.]
GDALRLRHALASAIATVNADRLFAGPASRWWKLPAQGTVEIDGVAVTLTLSNEAERIDLNRASRAAMVAALDRLAIEQAGGMVGVERDALVLAIEARRASGVPFYSAREVVGLVPGDVVQFALNQTEDKVDGEARAAAAPPRIADFFTVASGLEAPRGSSVFGASTESSQGDAIRVVACGRVWKRRGRVVEVGRFALRPSPGWQRVDGWDAAIK